MKNMTDEFKHTQANCFDDGSDERLIEGYAQGQMRSFELLYSRHKKPLYNYLRRQSNNHEVAEELANDVWLAVIKQASKFEPTVSFKSWLYKIAHNRLVDHWRKHQYSKQVLFDDLLKQQNAINNHSCIEFSSDDRSSELLEIEQLLNSLSVLSTEQVTALLLKIEGFSQAEIANITQTKQETIKSRLRYASKHLRLSLGAS